MKTFVLVHGTWHGGWCWQNVASTLRNLGHTVYTPTLTGLGERNHLMSPTITFNTHIHDITELIAAEELKDITLVGHSYGALVNGAVAESMPDRIQKLICIDMPLLENGESFFNKLPTELQTITLQLTRDVGHGIGVPPMPAAAMGIPDGPDAEWVNRRLTQHPLITLQHPYTLRKPFGNTIPKTFIGCVNPVLFIMNDTLPKVRQNPEWTYLELNACHDAMITAPSLLTPLLLS